MKVFLSHARKDVALARQLAEQLTADGGFDVWISDDEIAPGDNWAKKIGKALEDSELMLVLLTPSAWRSDALRADIEYALGSKKFEKRFFSVFVGPTIEVGKDIPWILLRLPHSQVASAQQFPEVIKQIRALPNHRNMSHANA